MLDIICALCGKNQRIRTLYPATFDENIVSKNIFSARRLPDRIHYRILKCEKCGLIFSSPIFTAKKLSEFYRESSCNYKDQIPYLIKTYFKIVKQIEKDLPKNPRILEVGCGNGFFLKALKDSGFTSNIFGVEPSSRMVLEADADLRNKIKINIFKLNLFPKNSFDLILCFHVLDHMFSPKEFVQGAHSMLKKNGHIVVVVHDTEGLSVKLFGEKSAIFDVEHVFLFNKKTLKEIFLRSNFRAVRVFDLVNSYPLNYWIKMSGFSPIIKKFVNFIANMLGINKVNFSISAGNIGIIAKKRRSRLKSQ